MSLLDTLKEITSTLKELTNPAVGELILKNRFLVKVEPKKVFSVPTSLADIIKLELLVFPWDRYIQQISNPIKGKILNPIKYSDLYDYVDSFERNYQLEISFAVIDAKIVEALEKWMSLVYDEGFGYYDDYAGFNMVLSMLPYDYDPQGIGLVSLAPSEAKAIKFGSIYPTAIKFSELNHAHNKILRVNAQFTFKTMKITST